MSRSKVSFTVGLVCGIGLLVLWLASIDFQFLIKALKNINLLFIGGSGIFYVLAYFIRSFRWNLLLRNQVRLSAKESWLVSSAGNLVNYLIPIRAGEFIKAMLIKKIKKMSAVAVLPSVFIDKFFDTIGIFFVLIMIPLLRINISDGLKLLLILLILMFLIVFGILILAATHKRSLTSILRFIFAWMPGRFRIRIGNLIELFIDGLNIFQHQKRILVYAILLTAIGIVFDGIYFFMIFKAFSLNPGFMIVLFGYTLINLSYVLPQPPAQLGSNEWMMIIIFTLGFGFDKNVASSIMVFAHLFATCLITGLGIIGFSYAGVKSVQQINREL